MPLVYVFYMGFLLKSCALRLKIMIGVLDHQQTEKHTSVSKGRCLELRWMQLENLRGRYNLARREVEPAESEQDRNPLLVLLPPALGFLGVRTAARGRLARR